MLFVIGGLFLLIEVVALVVGLALAQSITGSVHELFAGTERVRQGDFTHKIAVTAHDQLGELAESFNSMTASIEDLLRAGGREEAARGRAAHRARDPDVAAAAGAARACRACRSRRSACRRARWAATTTTSCRSTTTALGVLIADVSGKGTSAALYMAELKGLMLSLSQIHTSPRELLIAANRIIAEHLDARSFITMTYAVVDLQARTMTYARAGHTPLIYVPGAGRRRRAAAQMLAPDGLVLGLKIDNGEMFERLLEEETMPLARGRPLSCSSPTASPRR